MTRIFFFIVYISIFQSIRQIYIKDLVKNKNINLHITYSEKSIFNLIISNIK